MSLAGHNILVVDANKKAAKVLCEGLTAMGANIFVAHDEKQCQALQTQWDIDILVCASSFLAGAGLEVVKSPEQWGAKPAPLMFAYGKEAPHVAKKLISRGLVELYPATMNAQEIGDRITKYLFNPKEHFEKMANADKAKQISLVLQNAGGQWTMEVQQLSDDGLTGAISGEFPEGQTAVLNVVMPDDQKQNRYSVSVSKTDDGKDNVKLKILHKDKNRWREFLNMIESRQAQIDNFLLMSSGR